MPFSGWSSHLQYLYQKVVFGQTVIAVSLPCGLCWGLPGDYCEAWIVAYWGRATLNAVLARALAAAPPIRIPDLASSLVLEDTMLLTYITSGSLLY